MNKFSISLLIAFCFFANGCAMFRNYQVTALNFDDKTMKIIGYAEHSEQVFYLFWLIPFESQDGLQYPTLNKTIRNSIHDVDALAQKRLDIDKTFFLNPAVESRVEFPLLFGFIGYFRTTTVSGMVATLK